VTRPDIRPRNAPQRFSSLVNCSFFLDNFCALSLYHYVGAFRISLRKPVPFGIESRGSGLKFALFAICFDDYLDPTSKL